MATSFKGLRALAVKAERKTKLLTGVALQEIFDRGADELEFVFRRNVQRFTPGGVKDLTPKYKLRKEKQVGYAYPILYRTGVLMAALYTKAVKPVTGHVWKIRYGFAGIHPENGVDLAQLAEWHINGEGRNPKRDFTTVPKEWQVSFVKRVSKALTQAENLR